jgi:hypothetical protein
LEKVKADLSQNAREAVNYIQEINKVKDCTRVPTPEIKNLEVNTHMLKIGMA